MSSKRTVIRVPKSVGVKATKGEETSGKEEKGYFEHKLYSAFPFGGYNKKVSGRKSNTVSATNPFKPSRTRARFGKDH